MNIKAMLFLYLRKIKRRVKFIENILYTIQKKINYKIQIQYNNKIIILPMLNGVGAGNIVKGEAWMDKLIEALSQNKVGAFIDVGVNIGQTLIKVKSIDPDIQYIGFEPNPNCYSYICELIKENNFLDCDIFPVGLSSKDEIVTLFSGGNIGSNASIIEEFRDPSYYSMKFHVPVFQGDKIFSNLGLDSISIIKIDVEGGELEVLQGLENVIIKYKPYIICEILPIGDETTTRGRFRKKRQTQLEKALNYFEYKIYRICKNGSFISLDTIETHSDVTLSNYVFSHKNQIDKLINF